MRFMTLTSVFLISVLRMHFSFVRQGLMRRSPAVLQQRLLTHLPLAPSATYDADRQWDPWPIRDALWYNCWHRTPTLAGACSECLLALYGASERRACISEKAGLGWRRLG